MFGEERCDPIVDLCKALVAEEGGGIRVGNLKGAMRAGRVQAIIPKSAER
jgi:hypothetical protein